jgi:hypothetical protein
MPETTKLSPTQHDAIMKSPVNRDGQVITTDRTLGVLVREGLVTQPRYSYSNLFRSRRATGVLTPAGQRYLASHTEGKDLDA